MYQDKTEEKSIHSLKNNKFLSKFKDVYDFMCREQINAGNVSSMKNTNECERTDKHNDRYEKHIQEKETAKEIFLNKQKEAEINQQKRIAIFDFKR